MLVRWIGIVGSLVLVLSGTPVAAQSSADAYFHEAAQQYVAGNKEAAQQAVERGLEVAPSDPRLQALRDKLNQESEDRGGGGGAQQDAQTRQQSKQSGGEETYSEASGEDAQDEETSDFQSPQSQQAGRGAPRSGTQPTGEGEPVERNALTRDQAARLLRALQNQEMKLLREVQGQASETASVEKDW